MRYYLGGGGVATPSGPMGVIARVEAIEPSHGTCCTWELRI